MLAFSLPTHHSCSSLESVFGQENGKIKLKWLFPYPTLR